MGRGFSAHRSHSKRLTNKEKRARSSSVLQAKKDTVAIKPPQHHKIDAEKQGNNNSIAASLSNVETSTAKRRGISAEKRAADQLAASGRTRSESVQKTVYLGNKMVRSVNFTRHFSTKKVKKDKKNKKDDSSDDDAASAASSSSSEEEKEVFEDFMDEEPSEDESETIRRADVFTKYVEAGKVVDAVLATVAEACVPGANTMALCQLGDQEIFKRVATLFKNTSDTTSIYNTNNKKKAINKGDNTDDAASNAGGKRSFSSGRARSGVSSYDRSRSSGTTGGNTRGRSASVNPMAVKFTNGLPRGVAFPCTVSVNEVLCNHTPYATEDSVTLRPADVVKIHCGVHVDGYPVSAAKTVVVKAADVAADAPPAVLPATAVNAIEAARVSLAGAIHLMRPGAVNDDITDFIASVGAHYQSEAVEGVLSTRAKRWIIDSISSAIICRRVTQENPQQDVAYCEVEPYQVWALDIAFTNSSSYRMGVPQGSRPNSHCNIFRKNEILSSNPTLADLRSKAATHLLTQEIRNKFHCFPFNPNHADEPLKARLGLTALKKAGQIDCFDELTCKPNSAYDAEGRICKKSPSSDNRAITARFCATVAVTERRVHVLCGGDGIISNEFLSKKRAKEHKKNSNNNNNNTADADVGGFKNSCGGLDSFEEVYGSAFPFTALGAPSSEFESEHVPLFVRMPSNQLKGLLSSPLSFGKTIVAGGDATAADEQHVGAPDVDDQDEEAEMAREDLTAKRKLRRTEPTTTSDVAAVSAAAAAAASLTSAAPVVDAEAKAKLVSMHPARKVGKK